MPESGEFRCSRCSSRVEVVERTRDPLPSVTGTVIRIRCHSCGKEGVLRGATWRMLNPA